MDRGELVLPEPGAAGRTLSVVYHAPCHLRAQGMGLPGLELLRRIPGVSVSNANAGCCGISGSYGFKKEKYEIAVIGVGNVALDISRTTDRKSVV